LSDTPAVTKQTFHQSWLVRTVAGSNNFKYYRCSQIKQNSRAKTISALYNVPQKTANSINMGRVGATPIKIKKKQFVPLNCALLGINSWLIDIAVSNLHPVLLLMYSVQWRSVDRALA
jgi:hypothetical protein